MNKILILIFLALALFLPASFTSVQATTPLQDKIIVVDPGHGGSDSGTTATGDNGIIREADVTLDIAKNYLKPLLEADGATVVLTRDCDCDRSNNDRYTTANTANNGNPGDVLVSIHLNGSNNKSIDYTRGLYGKPRKDLAFTKVIHNALASTLEIANGGVTNFASGVLLKSEMPATMAETVFITNYVEYEKLTDGTGNRQQQIAESLHQGLINWFSSPTP